MVPRRIRVVVVGNPNAGKSTIFNRLTGLSQKVANYPGVTVEKKTGHRKIRELDMEFIDLPGTYSLAAHSPDEMVAVDLLLGHAEGEPPPDLVLQVVDASNLERNLYLLSQVLDLGVPVVVALNMIDIAQARGISIDAEKISSALGASVVPVEGHRGLGFSQLEAVLHDVAARTRVSGFGGPASGPRSLKLHDELHEKVEVLTREVSPLFERAEGRKLHSFEVLRAVIDRGGHAEGRIVKALGQPWLEHFEAVRRAVAGPMELPALEAKVRYGWVRERLVGCVTRTAVRRTTPSERIDRLLTHKVLGFVVFGGVMLLVFQSIFAWAKPLMEGLDGLFQALGAVVEASMSEGALRSLLVDGVIAGVGMIVVFLPQILILFLFIGLLEDCGYMARAAFLMDRIMQKCGLSGKSFIPMLSGFACAVPGIIATRVIEDRRDRLATILVTPLMSCSARLPVYAIFIGTFIPDRSIFVGMGLQGLTLFALYVLGIVTAVMVAWLLRRTLLKGAKAPFVMELPSYKVPALRGVMYRLYERAVAFLLRAGTTILAMAVVVWALAYFPHRGEIAVRHTLERDRVAREVPEGEARLAALAAVSQSEAGDFLRESFFGQAGRAVEPFFRPLGWDWKISMAVLASFPAREVVISTLGIIYNLGQDVDERSNALRDSLKSAVRETDDPVAPGVPVYDVPVALSILVFFALCCQCGATVATIKRESNSWRWAIFAFSYMTALAYVASLILYQVGSRL